MDKFNLRRVLVMSYFGTILVITITLAIALNI